MQRKARLDKYDYRESPAYPIAEAAYFIGLPPATVRAWVKGYRYKTAGGVKTAAPIIQLPTNEPYLSFLNLVEAHVLAAIRKGYNIPLPVLKEAMVYLKRQKKMSHPLADQEFETDGIDLFIQQGGQLINITRGGQLAIKEIVSAYLKRVERDKRGLPIRLYPYLKDNFRDERRPIVIDPAVSFGLPVITGTGIRIDMVAERFNAGEEIEALADDYGLTPEQIKEAIVGTQALAA